MAKGVVLGGLNGQAGSNIKSIQRISVTYFNTTSKNVAIAAVDISKTIVIMEFSSYINNISQQPNVELTSSTNILLTSKSADNSYTYTIDLYVIEFKNVKSKQTGSYIAPGTSPPNPYTTSIANVDPSKCLAFASVSCSTGGSGSNPISATVSNNNTLSIRSWAGTGVSGTFKWQVIEFA